MPDPVAASPDSPGSPAPLDAEDAKLVTLAKAARARIDAIEGAAVRDQDGRTYAAATVTLPSLTVSALQLAVANAVAAGAKAIEAAAVVTEASTVDADGFAAVRDLSATAMVYCATPDGKLLGTL